MIQLGAEWGRLRVGVAAAAAAAAERQLVPWCSAAHGDRSVASHGLAGMHPGKFTILLSFLLKMWGKYLFME
jgi:hypothetical protein